MNVCSINTESSVEKLTDFGLSVNQAKVYFCIVKYGPIAVNRISVATNLHKQDVYKILPKLEKKGLTTKKLGKPILISAIPLKDALSSLILLEQKKADEKTNQLKEELRELAKEFEQKQEGTALEESSFVLINGLDAVAKRALEIAAKAKQQHDAHFDEDVILKVPKQVWRKAFQIDAQHGVKQRLLIGTLNNKDSVKKIIKEVRPPKGMFEVRTTSKKQYHEYMIIDNEQAYITTQKGISVPFLSALWTNNMSLVWILKENFEKIWNSPKTEIIYEQ